MNKKEMPNIKRLTYKPGQKNRVLDAFIDRPAAGVEAYAVAARVVEEVAKEGDRALLKLTEEFEGKKLKPHQLVVSEKAIDLAVKSVNPSFKTVAREAHKRIRTFAQASLRPDWKMETPGGGFVGEKFVPLERVGAYIPGGTAPLVSTALMTITLARAAGVPHIIACSPLRADGTMNPYTLFAMQLAGATEIYGVGGAQAIAAMAYGTETIAPVQKIVGPGNSYVTAAKKLVYGKVAIDMLAGPSEIAVLADDSANPKFVAADLLSQAEHGSGFEQALLVSNSDALIKEVRACIKEQAQRLPKWEAISKVLATGMLLVKVETLDDGVELINRFAPEHFELMVKQPATWEKKIRTAGAIFIGPWTPESAGDYIAGPSHVLPTGGTAAMFAGLTAEDFRKRTSLIRFTKKDLQETRGAIESFGTIEALEAHARAATIRFE